MDGIEVLSELRKRGDITPVILLTGYASLESAKQAVTLDAADYLLKPLESIDELLRPVNRAVKNYRLMLENKDLTRKLKANVAELADSNRKFRETQQQLIQVEKMEEVGRMASGVAHEVKNPLGIILQGINYFEEKVTQKDDRRMLQKMKNSIKRADNIVCALLDFSRAEEFKMKPEGINSIIGNSLGLIEHKLKIKDIEVFQELEAGLLKTVVDRGKIEQVLVNLFLNAVDALPEGGKLYVRSRQTRFNKLKGMIGNKKNDIFNPAEKVIVIEVEDKGAGMDEDTKKKLFDPFFTTKGRTEGTGLGLSIAQRIIEMHSSLIKVESETGKGTKVTLVFKTPEGE